MMKLQKGLDMKWKRDGMEGKNKSFCSMIMAKQNFGNKSEEEMDF